MDILTILFSATNNTLTVGKTIDERLKKAGAAVTCYNIANRNDRSKEIPIESYEGVIFGFPVYAWRIPELVREWISRLNGKNTKCAMFFTYGGIHMGAAHYDTKKLLEKNQFRVIASAEFVSSHTYRLAGWDINLERPNEDDLEVARRYAELVYNRFTGKDAHISHISDPEISEDKLNKIKLSVDVGIKVPKFDNNFCTSCGLCKNLCPVDAIKLEKMRVNRHRCIKCFRCVFNCPEDALNAPDLMRQLEFTKKKNNLSTKDINNKKSKILK